MADVSDDPLALPDPGARRSPFPAIADYAFLSDCHTGALVAPDGTVEWMCVPRFDSPSLFGMLLDRGAGGFRLGPYGESHPVGRRYEPGSNVLETTWMTRSGWAIVRDALTIGDWAEDEPTEARHTRPPTDHEADHLLVRTITCIQGEVMAELVCEPMFGYGSHQAVWTEAHHEAPAALDAEGGEHTVRLLSDMRLGIEGNRVRARHQMQEGDLCYCVLTWTEALDGPATAEAAREHIHVTAHYWRSWLESGTFPDHHWRSHLQRSALTLKGLTYAPTGALVAAPTTSLPETPGGERNWDYRYSWMRDASFTLWALHAIGLDWEADDFMQFVADIGRNEDGSLQIMYGIDGERDLTESTLDDLSGYDGAKPVRIGNASYKYEQHDVWGAILDAAYIHSRTREKLPERVWPMVKRQVELAAEKWDKPDRGIWASRGEPRHYTTSKVMCWVALDRGARLAAMRGEDELQDRWTQCGRDLQQDVLDNALRDDDVFVAWYGSEELDASVLLIPLVRFLPASDPRVKRTVTAIGEQLTEHGLVLRRRPRGGGDEAITGEAFAVCSFWYASALVEIGEEREAREVCERMLNYMSPLGLYAEHIDPHTGRHLGNYPHMFTHLALVNTLLHLIRSDAAGSAVQSMAQH